MHAIIWTGLLALLACLPAVAQQQNYDNQMLTWVPPAPGPNSLPVGGGWRYDVTLYDNAWMSNAQWQVQVGSVPVVVAVTDAFFNGDTYLVTESSTPLLTTSAPTGGSGCTFDPDFAFADARWSHGSFVLTEPGTHTLSLENRTPFVPYDTWHTAAYFIKADPVPEPGTLALLGAGMAGLAVLRRRRKG